MSEKQKKTKPKAKWYYWAIAGAILATLIMIGFVVVPQIILISQEPGNNSSANKLTNSEANQAFDKYWKILPHAYTGSAWSFNDDLKPFIKPDTGIEYMASPFSEFVLNAPLWKSNGLKPGVVLVVQSSTYDMNGMTHSGTVIFSYNWTYSGSTKTYLPFTYVVVCNLVNFDVAKAAGNYTIKYI